MKWVQLTIKKEVTLGITGSSATRVHINLRDCHLDVESSLPPVEKDRKGLTVRKIKRYVI
jgi:hypothetical protein